MVTADATTKAVLNSLSGNGRGVVESGCDDNGNWWRKYADGWIEQGGFINGYGGTITFPKAFSDTKYTFLSFPYGQANFGLVVNSDSRTTTSIYTQWWAERGRPSQIYYRAEGY